MIKNNNKNSSPANKKDDLSLSYSKYLSGELFFELRVSL